MYLHILISYSVGSGPHRADVSWRTSSGTSHILPLVILLLGSAQRTRQAVGRHPAQFCRLDNLMGLHDMAR